MKQNVCPELEPIGVGLWRICPTLGEGRFDFEALVHADERVEDAGAVRILTEIRPAGQFGEVSVGPDSHSYRIAGASAACRRETDRQAGERQRSKV